MENPNQLKVWVVVLVLLVVGFGVYLTLFVFQPKSEQFSGNVSSINGNSLQVKGYFMVNGKIYNGAGGGLKDVKVSVTPETKFNATVLYSPTATELAKTNGVWDMSALKKEEIAGSMSDLTPGSIVFINTDSNIFGQSAFNAKSINYTLTRSQPNNSTHLCEKSKGEFMVNGVCVKK